MNFENVSFKYDSQAEPTLRNINLTINQGEKVLIVGPSGSGKTTLGNLINGLIPHALTGELTGKVTVAGVDVARANLFDLSLHVGTVLQDPDSQFVSLTAAEDIAFALENDETALPTMQAKVKHWAKELDLELQLSQNPQTLSGGQKQRNAMAGVLIDEGEILLFDEPLAALDPAAGAQAMALIEQLHERLGMTVVMIEHRIEDVLAQPVDRIIVMSEGQIIADDRPEVILQTALFKEVGLRAPLYLEALQAAQVPLTAVTNLSDVEKITAPDLGKQLQIWQAQPSPATAKGATTPLLTLAHVDFKYVNGPQIFKDFNLTINQGEMLAIVGKNGVGKTTLSQLITGFVQPNAGTITLGTTDLATLSVKERADKIGYVMQDPNHMISKVLIREEVALGLVLRGLAPAEIDRRVDEVLKVCGLYAFRNWPISALSFGQKKRVTIASILVLAPKVIILDEPTAGQDWAHYTEMMQFLQHLNATTGVTLIFITHDMHLMLEYATRTVALGADGILADASPATVLADATVVAAASLAQTSLYKLAQRFQLNPVNFTEQVIKYEMRGQHE
ncbi:ABC transporter ATP-binding protein [Periweissella ghanensis]|uniref:ABC transporter ATP-binding protein n=1 Tax=Periweissella ghanensis TaxID=467997 RepID=UPI001E432C77|nr:ABC transporter ATP-binding protein [Periweissella ghanensis]